MQNEQMVIETNQFSTETLAKTSEILQKTGLNWDVRKIELVAKEENYSTPNMGVFRSDNNRWVGTVSKQYTLYQNQELCATIIEAANQFNLDVSKGGELFMGQKVYLQLELPSKMIGKTDIKRFITALNSHNAKGSVAFGSSNQILKYDATFFRVFSQLDKFRHCSSVSEKVKTAVNQLLKTMAQDQEMLETFETMAQIQVKDELLASVMRACFNVDMDADQSTMSSRQISKITSVSSQIETAVKEEQGSIWGLFTGVLKFTRTNTPKKTRVEDFVMSGGGYRTNLKAFDTIFTYLQKNTKK